MSNFKKNGKMVRFWVQYRDLGFECAFPHHGGDYKNISLRTPRGEEKIVISADVGYDKLAEDGGVLDSLVTSYENNHQVDLEELLSEFADIKFVVTVVPLKTAKGE